MGGGVPIVDDALDFAGDVIGGAGDIIGDVVEGVGDVVEDLNPATIAAIVYFASTGDPSALFAETGSAAAAEATLAELGEQGFMDLLSTYGSDAAAAGEIMGGFEPVIDVGSLYSSELGTGSVLTGDLSEIMEPTGYLEPFDNQITQNIDDYSQLGQDVTQQNIDVANQAIEDQIGTQTVSGYTFGDDGSLIDPSGNVVAEGVTTQPLLDAGMSFKDIVSAVKNGMNLANLGKVIAGGGSILGALMPNTEDLGKFFTNLGTAAPLIGSAGLGYLAYKNRSDINKAITDAYNNYLGKQSGIASAYGVGAGPQTLPYTVAGVPLAQAQPRTAAQTVVMPKAAKGGYINDLYNEYSELNNRMRNYRRLAKGGLI